MPVTGTAGIECRSGGATNDYQLRVTFPGSVVVTGTPQAQVTTGSGSVGTGGIPDPNGNVGIGGSIVTIPLTNIANAQTIIVTLFGVSLGGPTGNVSVPMSILIGDTTDNGQVTSTDVSDVKAASGTAAASRQDIVANGLINSTDVSLVKTKSGTALP